MTRPLVLGHRGARASRNVAENTLASFELCLQHGCDGFEFDVRRSADGRAVVCHDPVVRGMEITRTTAAVLGLPTLDEVLRAFSARAFLDIELKVSGMESETIRLLREHPPQRGYVVSSFLPQVLVAARGFDAAVPLGFICDKAAELELWDRLPVEWIIPQLRLTDQTLIAQIHAAGKQVMVWTVNRADEIRNLTEYGVDVMVSDETELAVQVLAASR
jgi:glycerophosphoryl diester phosphodiesterase